MSTVSGNSAHSSNPNDSCSCSSQASSPDWVPDGCQDDPRFAVRVMSGVSPDSANPERKPAKRRKLTLDDYEQGVLTSNVGVLSRAITLVESNNPAHEALAQELLTRILPKTGSSIRIGITGVPGAGKSTLIESLGSQLCEMGHRVAVLAVDPSSSVACPLRRSSQYLVIVEPSTYSITK